MHSQLTIWPGSIYLQEYWSFKAWCLSAKNFPSTAVSSRKSSPCQSGRLLYVPTCIHLFPHARADTIQVVEHGPNFSKFYKLTISFLVLQFCTLESSLCVSSSDYWLISPFGSSLIKVVLNPKIRTTERTHQTTSVHRMNSWLITM